MAKGTASARRNARRRWLAALLLLVLVAGGALWWKARTWQPDRATFPVQGVWLSAADGPIQWPLLKAAGADFAYLTASEGAALRDAAFAGGLEAARGQKMQAGAVHVYDLCAPAEGQAANFVTTVPRDPELLPPAVRLDLDEARCPRPPGEAAMQSEITTFLNQIERHAGKSALLMLSPAFEKRYHLAAVIDRNLWAEGSFLAPGYPGRPWVLWTANDRLRLDASEQALHWVVERP
jgi:lysozyme